MFISLLESRQLECQQLLVKVQPEGDKHSARPCRLDSMIGWKLEVAPVEA